MKYSIGFSDSKKRSTHGSVHSTNNNHRSGGLTSYNVFKKYNTGNVGKNVHGRDKKKANPKVKKILYIFLGVIFLIGCLGLLGVGIYLKTLQNKLPSADTLSSIAADESTQILDRNGTVLYTIYGAQNREFVSLDKIPEYTKWAVLAAEDVEFYQHKGIDYKGIAAAILRNLKSGTITGGASTITQQLVRNTILKEVLGDKAYDKNYTRKIMEILITLQVEQTYTKDQILQRYMNEVPLGGVNYGFEAAAQAYFGKDVQDLDLAESAMLAGIIQSPGVYSPLFGTNPDMAKERQTYVLDQMLKHKDLTGVTEEEIQSAKDEVLAYKSNKIDIKAPHFVLYVKQLLIDKYGIDRVETGGLKVTTTLDYSLQQIAEEEVQNGVSRAKGNNINNGAMVVLDPNNGQILSMVGSVDYWNTTDKRVDGNVNVTTSLRQMGSSVKPFVYLTAFDKGYGPWMLAPDIEDISFGNYDPTDWDNKYMGLVTARKAIVNSRNVSAVYTLQLAGIDSYLQTMEKLGVTSLSDKASYGLSLALGSGEETLLEHATAYSVLATGGVKHDDVAILKVEDSDGNVLEEYKDDEGTRVFNEKEIYLVNWMLCDLGNFNDRPNNAYYKILGQKVCGKTGTSNGPKDLLTVLYDKSLVVAVWNGNNDGEVAPGAWGSTIPLVTANSFLKRVINNYAAGTFNRPDGILSTTICTDTGASPADGVTCDKEASVYMDGAAPKVDNRTTVTVCKSNNLVPDNLTAAEKYGLTTSKVVLSTKLDNTLQQAAYEKYLTNLKDSQYLLTTPGTGTCTIPLGPDNSPVVDISTPTTNQSVSVGSNLTISGSVAYLESISTFSALFDGNAITGATLGTNGLFNVTYSIPTSASIGVHTITVNAVDNYGKTGTQSVTITTIAQASTTITIANPVNGATVSGNVNFAANTSNGTVDSLVFKIFNSSNSEIGSYTATSSGSNNWVASINTSSFTHGNYTVKAIGTKNSTSITSNTVSFSY